MEESFSTENRSQTNTDSGQDDPQERLALELSLLQSNQGRASLGSAEFAEKAFHLGQSYWKEGRAGEAFAWLLFARGLETKDKSQVEKAFTQAKTAWFQKMGKSGVEPNQFLGLSNEERAAVSITLQVAGATVWLVSLVWIAWALFRQLNQRGTHSSRWGFLGPRVVIVFVFGLGSLVFGYSIDTDRSPSVVTRKNIEVKSGPDENYMTLGSLSAGVILEALKQDHASPSERRKGWVQIRMNAEEKGWVREDHVLFLSNFDW
jgi:hypothetical protein